MVSCLLQAKGLPTKFCVEVIYYANYIMNQIQTRVVYHVIPIKNWCGKNPLVDYFQTFGCVAWEHILNDLRKKMDVESHACIMMGYSKESKAYQLFDPIKQQIIIRINVIFDMNNFDIGLLNSFSSS